MKGMSTRVSPLFYNILWKEIWEECLNKFILTFYRSGDMEMSYMNWLNNCLV